MTKPLMLSEALLAQNEGRHIQGERKEVSVLGHLRREGKGLAGRARGRERRLWVAILFIVFETLSFLVQ